MNSGAAGAPFIRLSLHLLALSAYLVRHAAQGSDTAAKLFHDDGDDPRAFPFLDLFTSLMDLDAAFFLENTRDVFHERLLPRGELRFRGELVDWRAIRTTALLTVEGERDDIAAPGQTGAAHALASSLAPRLHRRLVVPHAGHFSLFHGDSWRKAVLPAIKAFCGAQGCSHKRSRKRDPRLRIAIASAALRRTPGLHYV